MKQTIEQVAAKKDTAAITYANKEFIRKDLNLIAYTSFLDGANWQKEELQPLIDSHAELLGCLIKADKAIKMFKKVSDIKQCSYEELLFQSAIEKAQSLINK